MLGVGLIVGHSCWGWDSRVGGGTLVLGVGLVGLCVGGLAGLLCWGWGSLWDTRVGGGAIGEV